MHCRILLAFVVWLVASSACTSHPDATGTEAAMRVRFATFNVSMFRERSGQLAEELRAAQNGAPSAHAQAIAWVVQTVRPDVLLLNEFDYDAPGDALHSFCADYLAVSQHGETPIEYPFVFCAPVNTGVPSGFDLDRDGRSDGPGDAFGFGRHPGVYGMAVLSRLPIRVDEVRTFRELLWRDMPDARIPPDWYEPEVLDHLRLSSKSHWDVPIEVAPGHLVHLLASHPTPPVFDGPEDRNGRRNHDEIRLWADYIDEARSAWIRDDRGVSGGLPPGASFVIAGDLNADPLDGDSDPRAIAQLLEHPRVAAEPIPRSAGGVEAALAAGGANTTHRGDPATDTGSFGPRVGNLRLDYVLPSRDVRIVDAGVFWPVASLPSAAWLGATDHRLVWVDGIVGGR